MIHHGDCLEILRTLESNSLDSLVTDPPAGIAFMGKDWDKDKGGRAEWVAWMTDVMRECLRVLKPGAHGLVWALPRTAHWTATALEDAGFEVRDCVTHLFGTGFPKSLDVSKAIDKAAGAERQKLGPKSTYRKPQEPNGWDCSKRAEFETAPATDDAKKWAGFGTALKPACEFWWLVRKPCSEKTVAANVLKHGTGAINVDGCRIETTDNLNGGAYSGEDRASKDGAIMKIRGEPGQYVQPTGRFPANLVLSHSEGCVEVGTRTVKGSAPKQADGRRENDNAVFGKGLGRHTPENSYGTETVAAWECEPTCAVRMLDEQSGTLTSGPNPKRRIASLGFHGSKGQAECAAPRGIDIGGASRFFYCAKASRSDRNKGCEDVLTWENVDLSHLMAAFVLLVKGISADTMRKLENSEWSIGSYGKTTTDLFQRDIRSTIETVTRLITDLKTSNCSQLSNISESILAAIRQIEVNGSSLAVTAESISELTLTSTDAKLVSAMNVVLAALRALSAIRNLARRGNVHSTVKSTKLMSYMVRLVTPPGGTVLDPFAGSGSTGVAALSEGFKFLGIEREAEYVTTALRRLEVEAIA